MTRIGSRAQVYHGNAVQTSGGLKKKNLFRDKHGCIKSKKASLRAKKNKNLGEMLKQKGSGCFDYKKTEKMQIGGGKSKKNVELDKHIFIFSTGLETFTLPNKYKDAKMNHNCNCKLNKLLKHKLKDHVEHPENATKKKFKPKKNKKGGRFGKLVSLGSKLMSKGAALGQKLQKADVMGKLDKGLAQIDKVSSKIDKASQAVGQVSQAVGQVQQQGQQLTAQTQQLANQVVATPQIVAQPVLAAPVPQVVVQQPPKQVVMVPQVVGGKKKKEIPKKKGSKKKKSSKKGGRKKKN